MSCILCFKWGNSHGIKPLPLPVMLIVAGAALSVTKKIVEIAQKLDWFAERTQRACKTISAR